jgi:hypothetical protein
MNLFKDEDEKLRITRKGFRVAAMVKKHNYYLAEAVEVAETIEEADAEFEEKYKRKM